MMTIAEVVRKLIGEINPVGSSEVDKIRLENLQKLTILIDELICDVAYVKRYKDNSEFSVNKIGNFADEYLNLLIRKMN